MSIIRAEAVIRDINEKVDPKRVALLLDYYPEKIQLTAGVLKCFCPLHREVAFRSLLIDIEDAGYRCTMKRCGGFEGGSLVELWAVHTGQSTLDAALDLADKVELDFDIEALRALGGEMIERSREALAAGNADDARLAIDQSLAFAPANAEARELSLQIYEAAAETDKADGERLALADLFIEEKKFGEARAYLEQLSVAGALALDCSLRLVALAKAEGDDSALRLAILGLAEIYSKQGNTEALLTSLSDLVEIASEDAESLERAADLYEKSDRAAELVEVLTKLSAHYEAEKQWAKLHVVLQRREAREPESLELREQIATTLLHLGDDVGGTKLLRDLADKRWAEDEKDRARELLGRLLDFQPDNMAALDSLAGWNAECGETDEAIAMYRRLAERAREDGDTAESMRFLGRAKDVDPDNLALRADLAETLLAQGEQAEALSELFELAVLYLHEPDPSEGFTTLDRIAELAADDVDAYIKIGNCLEEAGYDERALQGYLDLTKRLQVSGRHEEALAVFEHAERLDPSDEDLFESRLESLRDARGLADVIEACRARARAFIASDKFSRAQQWLAHAIKLDRTESAAKMDLCQLFEDTDRAQQAVALWVEVALFQRAGEDLEACALSARQALRLDPANGEAYGILAETLELQGRSFEALEMWKKSAVDLLAKDADSPEALKTLEHAIELDANDADVLAMTAPLKARLAGPEPAREIFEAWLNAAEASGSPADQLAAFRCAVEAYPDSVQWRIKLSDLFLDSGDLEAAAPHLETLLASHRAASDHGTQYREVLDRMIRIAPDDLALKTELAELEAEQGDSDVAGELFDDIARRYLAEGDSAKAIEVLERSLEHRAGDRDLLRRLAELFEAEGQADRAVHYIERLAEQTREAEAAGETIDALESLLRLAPDRLAARTELAELLAGTGRAEAAVDHYHHALTAHAAEDGASDQTFATCSRMLELAPDCIPARETMVECALGRSDIESAKVHLDELGELALRRGDLEEAEKHFRRIHELDPEDIGSTERLGRLYEAGGQVEKATEAYRSVLGLYRESDEGERAISTLHKLKRLAPDDLDLALELARALAEGDGHDPEAADEWFALISGAIDRGKIELALQAHAEAEPLLADRWERRHELAALFASVEEIDAALARWAELARQALAAGQPHAASDAAGEGLVLDETNVPVRELRIEAAGRLGDATAAADDITHLAQWHADEGMHAEAESYLRRALELKPEDEDLIEDLADSQAAQENLEGACATLLKLAQRAEEREELAVAISFAERALALLPELNGAADCLASLLLKDGQAAEAIEIWRSVAHRLAASDNLDLAIEHVENILAQDNRDIAALRQWAGLKSRAGDEPSAREGFFRLLDVAREDLSYDAAAARFEGVIELLPDDLEFAERFAAYAHEQNRAERATEILVGVIETYRDGRDDDENALRVIAVLRGYDPENLDVLDQQALLEARRGDETAAAATLQELAEARLARGEPEAAARNLARRAALLPNDREARIEAAQAFEAMDQIDEATTHYLTAVELDEAAERFGECSELLEHLIDLHPARLEFGEALAQAYERLDNMDRAVAEWLRVAEGCEQADQADRAHKFCAHAKMLAPKDFEPRRRLARLSEQAGEIDAALIELREMVGLAAEAESAAALLRDVVRLAPDDLDGRMDLAARLRELNRPDELFDVLAELERRRSESDQPAKALESLIEMIALRPDDPELGRRQLALLSKTGEPDDAAAVGFDWLERHLLAGDFDQAETMIAATVDLDPTDGDRRARIANLLFENGHEDVSMQSIAAGIEELNQRKAYEGAFALCRAGLELFPGDVGLLEHSIALMLSLGRDDDARSERLALAETYEARGETHHAVATLEAVLAESPDDEPGLDAMVELALRMGDDERASEHLIRLAEIHYVSGRMGGAIEALERILEHSPDRMDLKFRLADLHWENSNGAEARRIWLEVAEAKRDSGELDRAAEVYERIMEHLPEDIEILALLTDCYCQAGRDDAYLAHATRLGKSLHESGSTSEALTIFELLAEKFEDHLETWELLARFYSDDQDIEGRIRALKRLYKLHDVAGHAESALEALSEAVELSGEDAELYHQLGDTCLKLNRRADGLKHLKRAAEQWQREGEIERAEPLVARLLQVDPANLEMRSLAGSIAEDLGQSEAAAEHYGRAAKGLAAKRKFEDSAGMYERLLELDESRPAEREAYGRVLERLARNDDACDQYLILLDNQSDAGDSREAIRLCRRILKLDSESLAAHEHLFAAYESGSKVRLALAECRWLVAKLSETNQSTDAERFLERGLELAPNDLELRKRLVELLISTERGPEAARHLGQLASAAESSKDAATARWALERACEVDPDNMDCREDLARSLDQAGEAEQAQAMRMEVLAGLLESDRADEARRLGERICEAAPDDEELRERLADIFERAGLTDVAAAHLAVLARSALTAERFEQARRFADRMIDADPEDLAAREALVDALTGLDEKDLAADNAQYLYERHIEAENFESAEKYLRVIIEHRPGETAPRQLLISLQRRLGRREDVIEPLRRLAELRAKQGHVDQAIASLRELLEEHPEDTRARKRQLELSAELDGDQDLSENFMKLAETYHAKGNVDGALEIYEKLIAQDPAEPKFREKLLDFLLDQGRTERAAAEARDLAELYMAADKKTEASKVLDRALAISPDDANLRRQLAKLQLETRRPGLALETLRGLLKQHETDADETLQIEVIEQMLAIDDRNVEMRQRLADLYLRAERNDKVKEHRCVLAEQYHERKLYDLAEREYRRLLELFGDDVDIWQRVIDTRLRVASPAEAVPDMLALADVHVAAGRIGDTVEMLRRVLAVEPDNLAVLRRYIDSYVQIGDEKDLHDEYLQLAALLSQAGDVDGAIETYERLRKIKPDNHEVEELLRETSMFINRRQAHEEPNGPEGPSKHLADFINDKKPINKAVDPRVARAIKNYETILKLNPDNPTVQVKLADLLEQADRQDDADGHWARAANSLLEAGLVERVVEILEPLVARHPDNAAFAEQLEEATRRRDSLKALDGAFDTDPPPPDGR